MKSVCALVVAVWSVVTLGQTTATVESNMPPAQNENKTGGQADLPSCTQDEIGQDQDSVADRVSLCWQKGSGSVRLADISLGNSAANSLPGRVFSVRTYTNSMWFRRRL